MRTESGGAATAAAATLHATGWPMITVSCIIGCSINAPISLPDPPAVIPAAPAAEDQQAWTTSAFNAQTTSTAGNPSTGRVMWNTTLQVDATQLYISKTNEDGTDVANPLLHAISPGRIIHIRRAEDSAIFMRYSVNSVTDSGTYVTYGVTPLEVTRINMLFQNNWNLVIAII